MSPQLEQLIGIWSSNSSAWYERQALASIRQGWFREILGPSGDLYLLRCWLVEPKPEDGAEKYESGNSVLLHYFPQPDQDRCLHDHPWNFTTTILAGGYTEIIPLSTWVGKAQGNGPAVRDTTSYERQVGQTVERSATDLHLVGQLTSDYAWTLVRTGPRLRGWGFHPPGERWQPFADYLSNRKAAV